MNSDDVRDAWLQRQNEDMARAMENKEPQEALLMLAARYRRLSKAERPIVDQLLADQLASEEEDLRFLALALVREFGIGSALPALRRLADWLETQDWPGAPFEHAKVNQIIGRLGAGGD